MKQLLLLPLLLFQIAFAQTNIIDSLELRFSTEKNEEKKMVVLSEIVNEAFKTDLNKALAFAKKGGQLSEKNGNTKWQPAFYEMEGRMYANLLKLDTAVLFFNKAMAGYKSINNKKGQATTYFKIAWVHKKKEEIEKAMVADLAALKLMEAINDQEGVAGAMGRVSDDLTRQGRHKEALDYAKRTIEICEKNGFKVELVYAFFNAGNVSMAMGEFSESLVYYDKAIALNRELNLGDMNLCDLSNSRGNALKRLKRYPEALSEYKKAQALAQKINYTNAFSAVLANLGEINLLMKNYPEALKYQLKTIELMEKDGDRSNIIENYLHVSTIYEKMDNYPMALAFQKKARLLKDSTATKESDAAMSELLTKYETEKKQATIATQQQQLSQQSRVQWLSIGIAALLAGFLFVGYRSYMARTKANKLLAIKNSENELLLKEIHHRVKNNLEVVSSLLALQSAQIDDQHTKDAMQEGQNRVQSIGIVHQKLYLGTNLGAIEMKDYFINLGESILDSFGAEKRVTIECAMEQLDVDIDTAVPLGLIVNELLTNTLKYAFPTGQNGKVLIKLEKRKDGILQLEVSDNGVGKSGVTQGTGFGGQLVSLLTKQLSGSMRENTENGTSIYFEFDLKKVS